MTTPADRPSRPRWRAWLPDFKRSGASGSGAAGASSASASPDPQAAMPPAATALTESSGQELPARVGIARRLLPGRQGLGWPFRRQAAAASSRAGVGAASSASADGVAVSASADSAFAADPQHSRRRLPKVLPLPITSVALLLLLSVPAVLLVRTPRPRAVGLEQLLDDVSLLQSFAPSPGRPVPPLWRERLGPAAEALWRRQRGPWWQLWGDHTDAAPMLAFAATALPGGRSAPLPPLALRVGDLVVVAGDPLSRQLLQNRLRPQQRLSRGLQRRCLERLRQDQAVFWNQTGLGVITGPLAPLLQRLSQGCLSVELGDGGLRWQGEAGQGEALLLRSDGAATGPVSPLSALPADQLLAVEGGSLDLLLQGLLSRPLIRDPLAKRYGFDAVRLDLLRRSPFRLRLRPQPQGPFQASLELQLPVGDRLDPWRRQLRQLAESLQQQGLRPQSGTPGSTGRAAGTPGDPRQGAAQRSGGGAGEAQAQPPAAAATASAPTPAVEPGPGSAPAPTLLPAAVRSGGDATWMRSDGVVVGGWRWIQAAPGGRDRKDRPGSNQGNKGGQQSAGQVQLLFFLGPVPAAPLRPIFRNGETPPAAGVLRVRSRPLALEAMGLLPPQVPELVRRSEQLWLVAQPRSGGDADLPLSRLTGGLRVSR